MLSRNKLFYCDMCSPGERGARGFHSYADAARHIANENGLAPDDTKNIHDMMRWDILGDRSPFPFPGYRGRRHT